MRAHWLGPLFASSLLVACGSQDPGAQGDGGTLGDAASSDAAAPSDGAASDVAAPDASAGDASSPPDGGTTASGSKPPLGSTLCGSGTFSEADSIGLCQSSSPYFPPNMTVTKDCGGGGFDFTTGIWEAWCTPMTTYLFARFDGATGFGIDAPYGHYESGNGAGSANAYYDLAQKRVYVSSQNGNPPSKAAKLHVLRFDGNTDAGSSFRIVGSAALTWQ